MEKQNDKRTREVDELREHYDFDYSKAKPNRFAHQFSEESVVVVLDPDVAAVFPTSETANQALRVLITALGNLAGEPNLLEKIKSSATAVAPSHSQG
jgi:hypothetical protein